jgi:hypothetical protein
MKLISDIINELMDYSAPLAGPLLKTKVLSSRIGNLELANWVNGELNGYDANSPLPEYRKSQGSPVGSYLSNNLVVKLSAIPMGHFNQKDLTVLTEITIKDGIEAIEQLVKKTGIKFSVPSKRRAYIERSIINLGNPYFQIINMHLEIPAGFLTNILSNVRAKLLDFMLELETTFGQQTEIEDLRKKNTIINQIMKTTIHGNATGVVITRGNNNKTEANIEVHKGDKGKLKTLLEEHFVDQEDIDGLLRIIDDEPAIAIDRYSVPVNNWIKKMINKAIDGGWNVAIGAAGSVLADAIASYYGLK